MARRSFRTASDRKANAIPVLEGAAKGNAIRSSSYKVRLFDPRGVYPRGQIFSPDALYWGAKDLVFMATWSKSWDWFGRDMPYTEMDWASPQELRLMASILLCERADERRICFYPVHRYSLHLDADKLNLESRTIATRIKDSIIVRSYQPDMLAGDGAIVKCLESNYDLVNRSTLELERQPELFEKILTDDFLFLRGIAALLKAEMLSKHYEFWEEAIVVSFIALDASFQMVLRELRKSGVAEPTNADAANWLHQTFNEPFGLEPMERYFEEIYNQRVMTLHPVSRFGINPYAPLFHDDYSLLRTDIPMIFAYLLTGRHSADYLANIQRWGTRNFTER